MLADTLDVPNGARNTLLESAGFAPLYTSEPMTSQRLEYVMSAVMQRLRSIAVQ